MGTVLTRYDSIILGLDEAIRINKDELKGRRVNVEISPDKKRTHD